MLRGNHEGPKDTLASPHDFPRQLREKFGRNWEGVYLAFRELAEELYTCAFIPKRAFLAHGGIPTNTKSLDKIAHAHLGHPEEPTLIEILWNDPGSVEGVRPSFRGAGHYFGNDILMEFLKENNLHWLIRGHESAKDGYRLEGRTLTLFSCMLPHYGNKLAAYLQLPLGVNIENLQSYIHQF
jgi:hypothetical protein